MEIIYLITGFLLGGIVVFLYLKSKLVPKTDWTQANDSLQKAQIELSSRPSKEILSADFVSRALYELIEKDLSATKEELNQERSKIIQLSEQLSQLKQKEESLNEKISTFKDEMNDLHERSKTEFKVLASSVFDEKRKAFVDENKKEMNTIFDPLKSDLQLFKEKIEATRKEDIQDMTSLKSEIDNLQKLNVQLSDDAKNLATALKSEVKVQGNWGEDRLLNILESEGLVKYIDFDKESSLRDDEQERLRRPDFILKLPNGKSLVIDCKVSLTAYVNYFNATTPKEKEEALKLHLKSVSDHINKLADKNYHALAGIKTPEYIFLFMPIEGAMTLALNQQPQLFETALKKQIVLITPTTFAATMKVVKLLWQKEHQAKNVDEIFRQCGELYNKFLGFLEDMSRIETALNNATTAYTDAKNGLSAGTKRGSTILGRFEVIKNLQNKSTKEIPDKFLKDIDILPDDDDKIQITHTVDDVEIEDPE